MGQSLLTLGQMIGAHARLRPQSLGVRDLERSMTFLEWNRRSCRLANALLGLGLARGDRVAVLAYNCIEWAEIYVATAKAGLIAVPMNFRLSPSEVAFIVQDAGASVLIAQDALCGLAEEGRDSLGRRCGQLCSLRSRENARRMASLRGSARAGERPRAGLRRLGRRALDPHVHLGHDREPEGRGARPPEQRAPRLHDRDRARHPSRRRRAARHAHVPRQLGQLLRGLRYCGAVTSIYSRTSFDPEHCLHTLGAGGSTFTSLVPTHYIMMLGAAAVSEARSRPGLEADDLLGAGAGGYQARRHGDVPELRPLRALRLDASAVGSTMLRPHEQFTSSARSAASASARRRSGWWTRTATRSPMASRASSTPATPTFSHYWNQPGKTEEAFRGAYCTVGDMAIRDDDGYIKLVDRKKNMIISGGENIYPSEVEAVLGACPKVKDVAIVGLPDDEVGRARPRRRRAPRRRRRHRGASSSSGAATRSPATSGRARSPSSPRSEMPSTATGKILHRVLKTQTTAAAAHLIRRER